MLCHLFQTTHRIAEYMGLDTWNTSTTAGTNVQNAVDYAMPIAPGPDAPTELYPDVREHSCFRNHALVSQS